MPRKRQIVIVSNRLPVHRVRRGGNYTWATSPGGLVSALLPVLKQRKSTWIGWSGSTRRPSRPFEHEGIRVHPVGMSPADVREYYEGFCNRTIWPLYHGSVRTPEYKRQWWWPYQNMNYKFAQAAVNEVAKGGTVWVQDYHLQLVPAMIREARPDVRIGFFLHIPFPPRELFAQMPWRKQILEGLLGADLVGFQTRLGAHNFIQLAKRYADAYGTGEVLHFDGREVQAGAYPISIDFERIDRMARTAGTIRAADQFRRRVGSPKTVMLGVDRLDYTKGIDIRLRAFQEMLRATNGGDGEYLMVQVAVPSRERLPEYQELRDNVARLVGEINGEFGTLGFMPVHYLRQSLPTEELVVLYRAADMMLVTPLRDGMNLVAKEYVASRVDDSGTLILSEFTGASNELRAAVLVNPHDLDGLQATIDAATQMPVAEQARAMRAMRRVVRRSDVYHWANTFFNRLLV